MTEQRFTVAIVGGGVTGLGLAYVLSRFTNIKKIILFEKYGQVAQVNSHPLNNAQTSHDGSTEANYSLGKSLLIKQSATYLRHYVDSKNDPTLSQKVRRMVIAINAKETARLKDRYEKFKPYYPDLWLADWDQMESIEPNVIKERKGPKSDFLAMGSNEGYVVNYQKLAEYFAGDAQAINPSFKLLLKTKVNRCKRTDDGYLIEIMDDDFNRSLVLADVVVFAAGPYSLFFAQKMGYGLDCGLLSVRGSFCSAGHWLNNKVYRMQVESRPFAEIHGDPDILNMHDTRFGPTTKPLPLMESYHYETFWDFIQLPLISSLRGLASLFKILWKQKLTWYVFKNLLFDLPIIGKALFLFEVKKIVPKIGYRDLKLRKGVGGIRPQIVNLKTGTLEMGDASLVGDKIIFNTTPSPGASVCLGNAKRDAERVVEFLGPEHYFDEEKFEKELGKSS